MIEERPQSDVDRSDEAAEARERSLVDDVRQLAEDAKAFAAAELAYQKSRAAYAGQEAKGIAAFGALALALVFFALMALTVGCVIALAPLLTAWGAMAAVTLALLGLAALCGLTAAGRARRLAAALADTTPGQDSGRDSVRDSGDV